MNFSNGYTNILFKIEAADGKRRIFITEIIFDNKAFVRYEKGLSVSHVSLLGKKYSKLFNRYASSGEIMYFVGASTREYAGKKELTVEEQNERIIVKTVFTLENDNGVLSVYASVTNVQEENITLECVAPLVLNGIMLDERCENVQGGVSSEKETGVDRTAVFNDKTKSCYNRRPRFFKVHNTWCMEAIVEEFDLDREGMRGKEYAKRCGRIVVSSNGSQTTARYLPLGIFQKDGYGYLMFEILPQGSWSYEIAAGSHDWDDHQIYLCLSGKTLADNAWYKQLNPNETYISETVRLIGTEDIDGLLEHTTKNKRNAKRKTALKPQEQVVYNIFQQNCGPCPDEKQDEKWIPLAGEAGADYYVIDAGWFDSGSTHALGVWDECTARYPSGVIRSANAARAKGMKFGLWVELQCVGIDCEKEDLLPEYCYFHINGVRTVGNGRYQLNYAYQEVRDYADGIIKKLVERYDVDYIKIDYNQTQLGSDCESGSYTEGLAEHVRGYLQWFSDIQDKYPNILFETCASGGMMMDSNIAKSTTVFSVSDQGDFDNYPYILSNLPIAVLPEQSGIWCIPVGGWKEEECGTSDEQVVMNVINSLYGVMHLCSRIDRLTEKQKSLLAEGVAYYRELAEIKEKAVPVIPNGFTLCGDEIVFTGLKTEEKLYLSVYNLSDESKNVEQGLSKYGVETVMLTYPKQANNAYDLQDGVFTCQLKPLTARSFEFTIKK